MNYAKQLEIGHHINALFEFYDETELGYDEYLKSVLQSDIQDVLLCFRSLIYQVDALKRKGMSKYEPIQPKITTTRIEKLFARERS
jgi:hypothetical protein